MGRPLYLSFVVLSPGFAFLFGLDHWLGAGPSVYLVMASPSLLRSFQFYVLVLNVFLLVLVSLVVSLIFYISSGPPKILFVFVSPFSNTCTSKPISIGFCLALHNGWQIKEAYLKYVIRFSTEKWNSSLGAPKQFSFAKKRSFLSDFFRLVIMTSGVGHISHN